METRPVKIDARRPSIALSSKEFFFQALIPEI